MNRLLGGATGGGGCTGIVRSARNSDGTFGKGRSRAFAQLLDKFEGERAAGAFIAVDGGCQEDKVGPHKIANKR